MGADQGEGITSTGTLIKTKGVVNQTLLVFVQDSSVTTGAGKTGIVAANLTVYSARVEDDNDVVLESITLVDAQGTGTDHRDGVWEELTPNMPGWYRFDPPDSCYATGASECGISMIDSGANDIAPVAIEIQLIDADLMDSASLGLSDLVAIESELIVVHSDTLAIEVDTGNIYSDTTHIHSDTLVIEAWALSSVASDTAAIESELIVVHSDTLAIESNGATADKLLGYTQLLARSDAAINTDRSTELGEINANEGSGAGDYDNTGESQEQLRDFLTVPVSDVAAIESELIVVHSDTSAIESELIVVHSDTLAIEVDTNNIYSDTTHIHSDTLLIEAWGLSATASDAAAIESELIVVHSDTLAIEVDTGNIYSDTTHIHSDTLKIESDVALLETTRAEPAQGIPGATINFMAKIDFLYKAWRNHSDQTASLYQLYNDDTTTVDHKATVSDDATTFSREEIVSGA